ncbi:alpha-isopropylmalate synthase regulatory domain-containing protein [Nocardia sp. SSK8]|uniref:alpha-isopropylmalate synthase regulatory domain-containing protein n=1 Tax=Nocardia sp. SSK8 TaxID=3120154 RepID=UPI00300944FF
MPSHRYRDIHRRVEVPAGHRDWPNARITEAPLWVPVDLRDGNQALAEPMDPARKRRFFELLVAMGYKEIEVGYPSASRTDFDFVRLLADTEIAPPDVTLVVFTPARRDLIERTVDSVRGITNEVVIHLYTATAPVWREVVLGKDRAQLRELILAGARDVLELAGAWPNAGRSYDAVIRVNSQSGKGGIAYLLHSGYGLELPRRLQIDLARRVQAHTDDTGAEITAKELHTLFEESYTVRDPRITLRQWRITGDSTEITLAVAGTEHQSSHATGPVEALTTALAAVGHPVEILGLTQHSLDAGASATAASYLEYRTPTRTGWSFGRDTSVIAASLAAVMNAANA